MVAPLRDFEPHWEYVVRLGYSWMSTSSNFGPTPGGNALYLDGEAAWRVEHVSFGGFSAFYTLRAQGDMNDQATDTRTDARYNLLDLGGRVTYHTGGAAGLAVGFGIADEIVYESGRASNCVCANNYCNPCTGGYTNAPYSQWSHAPLFELHVAATLPKIGPVAIELMALLGYSLNPDDHDYLLATKRLAIGGRF